MQVAYSKNKVFAFAGLLALALAGPVFAQGAAGANPIFDMLPQDIKDKGRIVIATDPQFGPPTNYRPAANPEEWAGVEPDLLRAIEPLLGVTFEWEQATFESIIPGVKSGRYDLGVNSLTVTTERQEQVDMVSWWAGVNMVIVTAGNPQGIESLNDLCGKTMAVVQGSADQAYLTTWSAENCGASQIELLTFKDRPACLLALQTERVAATAGGTGFSINLAYNLDGNQTEASSKFQVLDKVAYYPSPAGIAVMKGRTELSAALMAAIQQIMDDGTYGEVLAKWHWPEAGYLSAPALNSAGK